MIIEFVDVSTLFLVASAAAFICGGLLWHARDQHPASRATLVWATAGLLCAGAAMLLSALRGQIPDFLSFVLANALGPWAAVLMYESVRRFAGLPPVPWLIAGSAVALLLLQAWLGPTAAAHETRLLITSLVQGGFAAAGIPLLVRRLDAEPGGAVRWLIGFSVFFAAAFAVRFGYTLIAGAPVPATGLVVGVREAARHVPAFAFPPIVYAMLLLGVVNSRIVGELWALATMDTLTGVRTRRSFIEESRRAMARQSQQGAVLLMLDMDRFKQVNDQHGHVAGDRVLVRFAELLRKSAPAGTIVGRYGGEEFCMLLPDMTIEAGTVFAQSVCDRVRGAALCGEDPTLSVTVSIGLAGPPENATLEELLLAADRRLYLAKDSGRDQVVASDRPTARVDPWRRDQPRMLVPV